jgi:type I restriction enzyme S subunit
MLVPKLDDVLSFSGFIIRIRPNNSVLSPQFLLYFMKSGSTRARLTREGGGANISNINQGKLAALTIPVPSLAIQSETVDQLERVREETLRLEGLYERKVAALDELKQSLLREAFSGRL